MSAAAEPHTFPTYELLARDIQDWGVECVFGLMSDDTAVLATTLDAIGVRFHGARHENNAIAAADIVVVRFGDKYKQWNAAFDAGYAAALGKSLIVMHGPDHQHALKEVDAAALAVTETPEQVVHILRYVLEGTLP